MRSVAIGRAGLVFVLLSAAVHAFVSGPDAGRRSRPVVASAAVPAGPMAAHMGSVVAIDADAFYVLEGENGFDGFNAVDLTRIDRRSGEPTAHVVMQAAPPLLRAGDSLWVVGGAPSAAPVARTRALYRLDPQSLSVVDQFQFPQPIGALAGTAGGLWIATRSVGAGGSGDHLVRFDIPSGAITADLKLGSGQLADLDVDPEGGHFYTLFHGDTALEIEKRDAQTGAVLTSTNDVGTDLGGSVLAVPGGVWVTYQTGTHATSVRLGAHDLRPTSTLDGEWSNGLHLFRSLGTLFVDEENPTFDTGLWCADPQTGQLRTKLLSYRPDESRRFVGDDHGLFAVVGSRLRAMDVGPSCVASH